MTQLKLSPRVVSPSLQRRANLAPELQCCHPHLVKPPPPPPRALNGVVTPGVGPTLPPPPQAPAPLAPSRGWTAWAHSPPPLGSAPGASSSSSTDNQT